MSILSERDKKVLWHPCTQMHDHEAFPIIPITRGKGVYLFDENGNKYLDAVSSWWVNLFGHANAEIAAAIAKQAAELEHVIFAGFTHPSAINLAERLVEISPQGLNKVFFADNGSASIEVALKMSFHYWRNNDKHEKTKFVQLANSYHGETLGAMAVSDVDIYKKTYKPLMMQVFTAPSPDLYGIEPELHEQHTKNALLGLEKLLISNHQQICALILEPLIQCAGGMRMYSPRYLSGARKLCDKYNIHLIADEIATGFGRTGTMFACEQANISPDIMCVSKGITGGFLPLAATLCTDNIYDAFYAPYEKQKAFLHSHSYTGNAIACASANATLSLFEKHDTINKNLELSSYIAKELNDFKNMPHVGNVRQTGMVAAIELVKDKKSLEPYPWQERKGLAVYKYALKNGVLLRPLGNIIYVMPPYIITEKEIKHVFSVAAEALNAL